MLFLNNNSADITEQYKAHELYSVIPMETINQFGVYTVKGLVMMHKSGPV